MMHEFMKHQVWWQTLQVCHQLARYVSLLRLPPTPTWYLSPLPQGNRTQIRDSPWQGSCLQRKSTQWMNSFMMQSCKVSWLYLDIVNFIFGTEYCINQSLFTDRSENPISKNFAVCMQHRHGVDMPPPCSSRRVSRIGWANPKCSKRFTTGGSEWSSYVNKEGFVFLICWQWICNRSGLIGFMLAIFRLATMARLGNGVADCQEDPSGLVRITNFDMGRHQVRGDAVQAPDWLCHGTLQVRLGLCWWERWFLSHIHWWICSGPWPPRKKVSCRVCETLVGYAWVQAIYIHDISYTGWVLLACVVCWAQLATLFFKTVHSGTAEVRPAVVGLYRASCQGQQNEGSVETRSHQVGAVWGGQDWSSGHQKVFRAYILNTPRWLRGKTTGNQECFCSQPWRSIVGDTFQNATQLSIHYNFISWYRCFCV